MLTALAIYALSGAVVGILAGLLGVGGGIIVVPLLNAVFVWQGMAPELILHLSLGTSLGTIVFTSISSFRAHHKRGGVRWDIWRHITPGIVMGTFGGSFVAGELSTEFLKVFFVIFMFVVATQMLLDLKPKPSRHIPGPLGTAAVGLGIGGISSFAGIGGGAMSVPFMTMCNVPVKEAVGTSAAIGFPIALSGVLGYILSGWGAPNLPEWSLGYLSLPALAGLVIPSMITAPLGVRLAHTLPAAKLKRVFAVFVYIMAIRMLYSVL